MSLWKKIRLLLSQIPTAKLWDLAKAISAIGITKLILLYPNGLWGFSWNDLLYLLAILGIYKGVDVSRHIVPDKRLFEFMRTGDGSAPVSAKLALKLEREAVAETAVQAMTPSQQVEVKAEVTVTEASVTPPKP